MPGIAGVDAGGVGEIDERVLVVVHGQQGEAPRVQGVGVTGPQHERGVETDDRLGLAIEPEIVGKYRAGDIRHCIGDPSRAAELLGFRAEVEVGSGLGQLATWLAGQEADDRVEQAMDELRQRGLER